MRELRNDIGWNGDTPTPSKRRATFLSFSSPKMSGESAADVSLRVKDEARSAGASGESSGRRRFLRKAAGALLIVAGFAWVASRSSSNGVQPARDLAPPAVPVGVTTATKGDFQVTLAALGTVKPLATVSVKTQISGRLTQIGFEEGQMVKEDDFLAEIDPRPYRHALRQAQGQLMRDRALLENARLDRERYQRLVRQNSISRQQLDTQESLVRQYEGVVEVDEGNVANAALNLDYCRITAPVSGRVGLRQVDLGNYVQAGGEGIVVLTKLHPITVIFPLAEDHLPKVLKQIETGRKLPVAVYDRSGRKLIAEGALGSLDAQVDTATGTVKLKAEFDNRDSALFPNQFVNVRLLVDTLRQVTVIPSEGVQYGPNGAFAFVLSEDERAIARPLELGPAEGRTTAVLSGLEAGERLVIAGADRLRDGAKVKAIAE